MNDYLKAVELRDGDEAWLIVDRDEWTEPQLAELYQWSQSKTNYGFALSNPKFELWLLLHFEDGHGVADAKHCADRLRIYMRGYAKSLDTSAITREMISEAIERARLRDTPPCVDWPREVGTTVYRLVEKLIVK